MSRFIIPEGFSFEPYNPNANTFLLDAVFLKGGHDSVDDLTALNSIQGKRLKVGMLRYAALEDKIYKLKSITPSIVWEDIFSNTNALLLNHGNRLNVLDQASGIQLSYYLDTVNGSDSNDGLTSGTAVKSRDKIMALTGGTLKNKRLNIARGSFIRSEFTFTDSDNAIIAAYGYGSKPIIDCTSDILAFTKTPGFTNLYQATITLPGSTKMMGNAFVNDSFLIQATSQANCEATPGSFYIGIANWQLTTTTIYVNAPGSVVPIADGKVYSYSSREFAIHIYGNNIRLINILTRRNGNQDGSIKIEGDAWKTINCRLEDGCRHCFYGNPSGGIEDTYFYRGRNDLEPPGFGNSSVVNAVDITGKNFYTLRSTFDAADGGGFTGPFGHGSATTQLFASVTHTSDTFIGINGIACAAVNTYFIDCIYINCLSGPNFGSAGNTVTITNNKGSTIQFINPAAGGVINCNRNTLSCSNIPTGFYRLETSALPASLNIDGDIITVTGTTSVESRLIRWTKGPVIAKNMQLKPDICNHTDTFVEVGGFNGGDGSFQSQNNIYPVGIRFKVNGSYLYTLAELQAAGFDSGSTYAPMPTPIASDDFNRADENLDVSSGWTRPAGAAGGPGIVGSMAIRSNALACISATGLSYYIKNAAITSLDHFVAFKIASSPAQGPFVGLRMQDMDNWLGIRWTSSQFQVARTTGGVLTSSVIASVAGFVTPTVGQNVFVGIRAGVIWIIVDNKTALRGTISGTVPTGLNCGIIGRSSALNPFIDDFSCGNLP